jgi:tripartite-type tricarboxylate transporter receptor subunit TctC
MTITRRSFGLGAATAFALPSWAKAQAYPSKPVRVIVPFSAGSGLDVSARIVTQYLSETAKTSFVMENREGANGIIGTSVAARSAPDGHTLLFVSPPFTNAYLMVPEPTYDPVKDFKPIARLVTNPILVVCDPNQPFKSFKELVAHIKANPGRVQYATSGKGSSSHLEGFLILKRYGLQAEDIPYKSFGTAITDAIAGRVHFFLSAFPALFPHVQSGAVRPLVVGSASRSKMLSDVPTLAEEYGEPGYEAGVWYGMLAPAGTPDDVVKFLFEKLQIAVANTDMRQKIEAAGNELVVMPTAQFASFIQQDRDKWGQIIQELGLKQLKT